MTGAGAESRGIQGFVIETAFAGGHNAPPRGFRYDAVAKSHKLALNDKGEPIYGPKDDVDLAKFKAAVKGLPFWLAGYYARPEKLEEVLAVGGAGVQIGTSFAFAKESGLAPGAKQQVCVCVCVCVYVWREAAGAPARLPSVRPVRPVPRGCLSVSLSLSLFCVSESLSLCASVCLSLCVAPLGSLQGGGC